MSNGAGVRRRASRPAGPAWHNRSSAGLRAPDEGRFGRQGIHDLGELAQHALPRGPLQFGLQARAVGGFSSQGICTSQVGAY